MNDEAFQNLIDYANARDPSGEYAAFLVESKKRDDEQKQALKDNPNGGCFYKPHVVQVHSGQYWRCAHGHNAFWTKSCFKCLIRHPMLAWKWHFPRKSNGNA